MQGTVQSGQKVQQNNKNRRVRTPGKGRKNNFVKPEGLVRVRGNVDRSFLIIVIALLCFGLTMVFSASFAYSLSRYGDSFYFIKRQGGFAVFGLILMIWISYWDYKTVRKFVPYLFLFASVLMVLVLIIGRAQGVAVRWLYIGPLSIQPSEIMKPVLVMFMAHFFAINQKKINDLENLNTAYIWGNAIPLIIIGIVCGLVLLEHHFSGTIIIAILGIIVMLSGGARKKWLLILGGLGSGGVLLGILFTDYAKERINLWLHPENFKVTEKMWQTTQGLTAIGSGGVLGVGIGNSYQKYSFVSQPQNDFIFTIVCEELGLIGAVAVIGLFAALLFRGYKIAMKAPDTWSSLTVIGIVSHVTVQAIINMLVVTNLCPNTGVSLPFFSYGGSSLVVLLIEMGIVLSISRYSIETHNKAKEKEVKKFQPKNIAPGIEESK